MISNNNGFAAIITCLALPVVLLSLGLIAFSMLKTRHSEQIQKQCRSQYYHYFSQIRSQVYLIEQLNPLAITLYQTQLALLPHIWIPSVLKVYKQIQNLRQKFDHLQSAMIKTFNSLNSLFSYAVIANIQKQLQNENVKIKNTLTHKSSLTYVVDPKLQIVRRFKYRFPPYDRHAHFSKNQKFTVKIKNAIKPKSWMSLFKIDQLFESRLYSATLESVSNSKLLIRYSI